MRGRMSDIIHRLDERPVVKGECTLLVSGKTEMVSLPIEAMRKEIRAALSAADMGLRDISRAISKKYAVSRQVVYSEALKMKKGLQD